MLWLFGIITAALIGLAIAVHVKNKKESRPAQRQTPPKPPRQTTPKPPRPDAAADALRREFGLTPAAPVQPAPTGTIMRFGDNDPSEVAARARRKAREDAEWRQTDPLAQKYTVPHTESERVASVGLTQFFAKNVRQYVAFDLETTGLSAEDDRIVEIAAVRVLDDQIVDRFEQLVDPGIVIPPDATAIHGITAEMIVDCPTIERVLPAFLDFMGADILAAHNASFDIGFLGKACIRYDYQIPNAYFDTMTLARYWPAAPNKRLVSLARVAGIARTQSHRALGDAELVAALIAKARELRKA